MGEEVTSTGKFSPSSSAERRLLSLDDFVLVDGAASDASEDGELGGAQVLRDELALAPAQQLLGGRVHERDASFVVEGAHAFGQAGRDGDEPLVLPAALLVERGVGKGAAADGRERLEQGAVGGVEGFAPAACR